jgi:hypothetical protein
MDYSVYVLYDFEVQKALPYVCFTEDPYVEIVLELPPPPKLPNEVLLRRDELLLAADADVFFRP